MMIRSVAYQGALILWCTSTAFGQDSMINERAAKGSVYRIVRHSGLQPDFTVRENADIRTAIAFIKDHERVIECNPDFIASVMDSTGTNWSAISILAHEIAHHLLGHTLDPASVRPGDELACDRYSGFILHAMGSTIDEALAAMRAAGDVHGTRDHPPKRARLEAIEQGWTEADMIAARMEPELFVVDDAFRFVVRFTGDPSTYYVNEDDQIVWFNSYAEPIEFGTLRRLENIEPSYLLSWADQHFEVDGRLAIWKRTKNGMQMIVGRMDPYGQ